MGKFKHGFTVGMRKNGVPPEFATWSHMLQRCTDKNCKDWPRYGGRGITVCHEWSRDFAKFLADMGPRPYGGQIERIDNSAGYSPGNCRWATKKEQASNRRSNHKITFKGRTRNIAQWADELGIKRTTLIMRITTYGWTVDRALTEPVRPLRK